MFLHYNDFTKRSLILCSMLNSIINCTFNFEIDIWLSKEHEQKACYLT